MAEQKRQSKRTEKKNPKDKLQYIWDYYKMWIIGAVVLVGLICYFASAFYHRPKDEILNVAFVNFYDDISKETEFYQDFLDFAEQNGALEVNGDITFDSNYFFDLSKASGAANTYYQKMIANLEAKTCDAVVCEYDNLLGIGESGRLLDLEDERVKGFCEPYRERMVTVEKDGRSVLIGIDISDSPVFDNVNGYANACYFAISSNAGHLDMVEEFLQYLLLGESK